MSESESGFVSVVVPVYNEQDVVYELVDRIRKACGRLQQRFEIVAVNDGSSDQTLALLVALSREVPALRVLDLSRHFGHMHAVAAGLERARGDAVIGMALSLINI